MTFTRCLLTVVAAMLSMASVACDGGTPPAQVSIVSINMNPAAATAGAVVQLSASISAPGQSVSSLTKHWAVTAGELRETPPDFSMLLKGTAKAASESTLDTTAATVYWVTPASGTTTITLSVSEASKSRTVSVAASPVTLSVANGAGNSKTVTVMANSVTDLYQAAFRINYTSAWTPSGINPGDFLGSASNILWLGQEDPTGWLTKVKSLGFVPCAITRKGNVAGVDGSGILATITFTPTSGTSSTRELSDVPFDLSLVMLRTSQDQPMEMPSRDF